MVVGIIREADRSLQEKMENHLAGDLQTLGYPAFSALAEFGQKVFDKLSEEQIRQQLLDKKIEAVMTIVLLDTQQEDHYVPGTMTSHYNNFEGYYRTLNERIQSKGYYMVATKYLWESNFYDVVTNKLLYSVQTQSFDPNSTESLAHEYGKKIVRSMEKNKVIVRQNEQIEKIW